MLSLAPLSDVGGSRSSDQKTSVSRVCLTALHRPSDRMKDVTLQKHNIVCSEHDNGFSLNPVKRRLRVKSKCSSSALYIGGTLSLS